MAIYKALTGVRLTYCWAGFKHDALTEVVGRVCLSDPTKPDFIAIANDSRGPSSNFVTIDLCRFGINQSTSLRGIREGRSAYPCAVRGCISDSNTGGSGSSIPSDRAMSSTWRMEG